MAEQNVAAKDAPTYHDLHITTPTIERTSIFNLPFRVQVTCSRVGAWQVWARAEGRMLGSDALPDENLGEDGFRLDVAGFVIHDSMPQDGAQ